jgi:hypothetical protein
VLIGFVLLLGGIAPVLVPAETVHAAGRVVTTTSDDAKTSATSSTVMTK